MVPVESESGSKKAAGTFQKDLRAAKRGDQDAFARIWKQFQPGLLRYLMIKAGPAAEDLAADTWLRVLRALPDFEGDEAGFRAWLFTAARNRVIDWYRGSSKRYEYAEHAQLDLAPSTSNVEADADENSATRSALSLISQLPPDQSEAVMLRVVAGLNVAAVAKVMKRSPGSVRVLCHRGLRRLEVMLSEGAETSVTGEGLSTAAVTHAAPVDLQLLPGVRAHG
jgi:RNA polymerase sigma-70 factor (ECF subfamily)